MKMFASLEADAYDRQYTDWELAVRIASRFRAFGRSAAVLSLLTLLMAGAASLEPMIVAYGIDRLRDGSSADATVPVLCLVVLVVGVGWWLLRFFNRRVSARLIGGAVRELQMDAFSAAIGHDLSFFDQYSSGGIVSRITSDTQDFSRLVELVTWQASGIVQTVILSIVLWRIEPDLTLILFAILPFVALFAVWFRSVARKLTRRGMQATAGVNDTIKETVSGIAVAKNFRREQGIYDEFSAANHRSYGANLARGLLLNMVFPVMSGLGGIAGAFLLYIGGHGVVQKAISMGAWYLFLQSLERFMYPLLRLTSFWTDVQTGLAAAERVFALVDAEHSVNQTGTAELSTLRGEIRFEHVDFAYRPEEPVLSDFSLDIAPGETLAFVGHTGAGKSSIARLLARFYEFQSGCLLVDGQDIRTLDLRSYRQQIGHVAQTPFLFSGTVGDNIRYGCPDASDEEVWQLARSVGEGAWLDALPGGLDTL
ncbi:MAG: ABC transporter ATP-binding protein, partial [Lentisphaeria bacterium]|nr:ABC transporter ATP-binding protein [Lentisphaeria bacterium]